MTKLRSVYINGRFISLFASDSIRTAMNNYSCFECGTKIKAGRKYLYTILGDIPSARRCLDCMDKARRVR